MKWELEAQQWIQEKGYVFKNNELLFHALTHPSSGKNSQIKKTRFETFEFLGDRVFGLWAAHHLFLQYPQASEGILAQHVAAIICRESLAQLGKILNIESVLRYDRGILITQPHHQLTLFADTVEALIGAVFEDGGWFLAKNLISNWMQPRLLLLEASPPTDPKNILQEWSQKKGWGIPEYVLKGQEEPDHAPKFKMIVKFPQGNSYEGSGTSKKEAARHAAAEALKYMKCMP
jgi:ribonuclease-3